MDTLGFIFIGLVVVLLPVLATIVHMRKISKKQLWLKKNRSAVVIVSIGWILGMAFLGYLVIGMIILLGLGG